MADQAPEDLETQANSLDIVRPPLYEPGRVASAAEFTRIHTPSVALAIAQVLFSVAVFFTPLPIYAKLCIVAGMFVFDAFVAMVWHHNWNHVWSKEGHSRHIRDRKFY